jgi:hypothetical protein
MIDARLPTSLRPSGCQDLIRLGRDNDGGYLVSRADVMATDCLIGLGVNDDWSFEQQFSRMKRCSVICYDASVGAKVFLSRYLRASENEPPSSDTRKRARTLISYLWFFRGRNEHVRRFVARSAKPDTVRFDHVVRRMAGRRTFLKIDIEGAEYGLLDDIVAIAPQLTGLAIEFHQSHRRLLRIQRFVDQVGLQLVHVHVNNCGRVAENGVPGTIELTFSSLTPGDGTASEVTLPHPLDQPNRQSKPDIALRFDDEVGISAGAVPGEGGLRL